MTHRPHRRQPPAASHCTHERNSFIRWHTRGCNNTPRWRVHEISLVVTRHHDGECMTQDSAGHDKICCRDRLPLPRLDQNGSVFPLCLSTSLREAIWHTLCNFVRQTSFQNLTPTDAAWSLCVLRNRQALKLETLGTLHTLET